MRTNPRTTSQSPTTIRRGCGRPPDPTGSPTGEERSEGTASAARHEPWQIFAPAVHSVQGPAALKNLGFQKLVKRDSGVYEDLRDGVLFSTKLSDDGRWMVLSLFEERVVPAPK